MSFPDGATAISHILVVSHLEASVAWYQEVLGAELQREYGGSTAVLRFLGAWLLLVTGGEPTADKPGVTMAPPANTKQIDHSFTIRVDDCASAYTDLRRRGATFLSPPYDWGGEIRCFFRDPDGHLFEISEAVG